jgi:tetratricopeptide (TPR) repeat protein
MAIQQSEIELPELTNPGAFALWWSDCLLQKRSDDELSKKLEACNSPIAFVRSALVLGQRNEIRGRARELAGHAISLGNETVRLFGLLIVGILDVKDSYQFASRDLQSAPNSLVLLEQLLEEARATQVRSALLSEVEARLYRAIGESSLINADYSRARKNFALAIALGQALKMNTFVYYSRLMLANVSIESGMMPEARSEYQQLISDLQTPPEVVMNAQMYNAFSLYWSCEDTQMLRLIEEILREYPDPSIVRSYCYALRIFVGVSLEPDLSDEDRKRLPNFMIAMLEVFKCLWESRNQRGRNRDRKKFLLQARSAIDLVLITDGINKGIILFFKGYILFQLGEYSTAANIIQSALKTPTIPSVKIMILGLALEISGTWNGIEIMRLDFLTNQMSNEISKISKTARRDMASRFSLLLPLAGAFFAVSPDANGEFESFLEGNIIDVSLRSIKVFKITGLRPTHVIQYTLKAFGFNIEDMVDGGGQLNAEEKVLMKTIGLRQHWFLPITPALLIYLLLKTHEQVVGIGNQNNSTSWKICAFQVVRRFGILPTYQRGPYHDETIKLEKAISNLVSGTINLSGFHRLVEH